MSNAFWHKSNFAAFEEALDLAHTTQILAPQTSPLRSKNAMAQLLDKMFHGITQKMTKKLHH